MRTLVVFVLLLVCAASADIMAQGTPKSVSIAVTATVQHSPLSVTLSWPADEGSKGYEILRKQRLEFDFTSMTTLGPTATSWTDTELDPGLGYEYAVVRTIIKDTLYAFGYVAAGSNVAVNPVRGAMLLLVDATVHPSISAEVERLRTDLWNEGWDVRIKDAIRTEQYNSANVQRVKSQIRTWYDEINGLPGAVFIIGRVAVPYSGMVYQGKAYPGPDGHPEHSGSWAADSYYSCMSDDHFWTDTYYDTVGVYPDNKNFPGDGKFDNYIVPASFDLQVGRVDFYNMGLFYKDSVGTGTNRHVDSLTSEIHLLKNYLDRDHAYRTGVTKPQWRGLVDDNFGSYAEIFARCAWMAYPALLGSSNIAETDYISTLDTASYLWSYGCGGGGSDFQSAGGIGTSKDISSHSLNTIFTMLFGSYFGDWDKANNLLRAPLAVNPGALTDCWAGRPFWFFHPMTLGETIGDCYLLSANNIGAYPVGSGEHCVHIALMGDPSLRMIYGSVNAPTNLNVVQHVSPTMEVALTWTAASGSNVAGYYVYRIGPDSMLDVLNNGNLVQGTSFSDKDVRNGQFRYIVRTVGSLNSNSGSFQELSTAAEQALVVSEVQPGDDASVATMGCYPNPAMQNCTISLNLVSDAMAHVDIIALDGHTVRGIYNGVLTAGDHRLHWNLSDNDENAVPSGLYFVRARIGTLSIVRRVSVLR